MSANDAVQLEQRLLMLPITAKDAAFTYNLIAPLFGLYLNLRERPVYEAEKNCPQLSRALMVILGLEDYAQYPEIVEHHERGTIPPTVMWGSTPSVLDPSQAPASGIICIFSVHLG